MVRLFVVPKTIDKQAYRASFARRLRQIREDLGVTQTEIGDWIGVSGDVFSKWENPRVASLPDLCYISPLADKTGLDERFILTGRGKPVARKSGPKRLSQ